MSPAAQVLANRANAISHGLRSSKDSLFAAHPAEQAAYNKLQYEL